MKTPVSTYRLQIRPGFTLADAADQVEYLADLGVDWLYLSPLLKAEDGSEHGYDVVDPSLLDPARGSEDDLAELARRAHAAGMGILLDIVPNHMGVAVPAHNPWWWSLLKEGQGSRYAQAFDVDWEAGGGKVRLPVLGSDADLDKLEVVVSEESGGAELRYFEHRFPLADGTYDDGGPGVGGPGPAAGATADAGSASGAWARAVHARQHYELVDWRRADHELNYRRFFAVNSLAGIRVEVPWVFDESHARILHWIRQGWVDGLRVDHPDGLADPAGYLQRLKEASGGVFVLVEKILEPGELLPADFRCEGTTGYDALAQLDRLFVDPAGEQPLTALDTKLRGGAYSDYQDLVHGTKRAVADGMLNSEIRRLARLVPPGTPAEPDAVVDALAELIGNFDVYRTYLPYGREHLERAAQAARRRRPDLAPALDVLLPLLRSAGQPPDAAAESTGTGDQLAVRFQQTSGMVMAKGVEDCGFYRYSRLTSLTEVGADPSVWSRSPHEFHEFMAGRQEREPRTMNALTTHDTKRSEDTRARISLLSEFPTEWAELLERLRGLVPLPDGPLENLLWQAIVGAWPASRQRLQEYALKAARESGNSTTWTDPDGKFEESLAKLVDAVFDKPEVGRLVGSFVAGLNQYWTSNVLAAKLLQLTIPGVPDVYQGSELWEQSLTDPDNRRPVDFTLRKGTLAAVDALLEKAADGGLRTGPVDSGLRAGPVDGAVPGPESGPESGAQSGAQGTELVGPEAKMLVTAQALRLRRDRPELFTGYTPVAADGPAADHLVAFDRGGVLALATRLPRGLEAEGGWRDTVVELPWPATDRLTGESFPAGLRPVSQILAAYPVALLVRQEES
jgi:(1->4)-alpha-D-glucan 1-alpha-D-glucosylmutase